MASMKLVELRATSAVCRELATRVARIMTDGRTEEGRARATGFLQQAKQNVRAADAPGFVSTVLSAAAEDLMGHPKRRVVEDIFSVLISMLNTASRTHNVAPTLQQLSDVVTSSTTDKTASRLIILGTCFNMFSDPEVRYELFVKLVKYAAATNQLNLVRPYFADAEGWATTWGLSLDKTRELYNVIATVLDDAGDSAGAELYRIKFLHTFESEPAEVLSQPAVRDAAVHAIVGFVKTPAGASMGKKHLVDMAAVRQLRDDAEHGRLFNLLNIFASGQLGDYIAYRQANQEYMDGLGVDHEKSLATIRLFTLCSVAATSADGALSYDEIATTLQISADEVEEWVLSAVRAKLLTARMDQLERKVFVSGYKRRVFDRAAWEEIRSKVHTWLDSVSGLLSTLRSRAGGRTRGPVRLGK